MWKPDWRKAAWYGGAGLVLLAVLSGSILANIGYEDRQNAERAQEASREERQAITALLDNPREQAIATETGERRRGERESSDLDAQWATAAGTIAQAVFGLLGLMGLGATVFYARRAAKHTQTELDEARLEEERQADRFKQQLAVAREQVDEARTVGRKQVRAYLATGELTGYFLQLPKFGDTSVIEPNLCLNCQVKNAGQSPAREVRVFAKCEWEGKNTKGVVTRRMRLAPISAQAVDEARVFLECPEVAKTADTAGFDVEKVWLTVSLSGIDVFGDALDPFTAVYIFDWEVDQSRSLTATFRRQSSVDEGTQNED